MPFRPPNHKTHDAPAYDRARREDHNFYQTKMWRDEIRPFVIARDGLCQICQEQAATVVDHIIDRHIRPDLAWSLTNMQGLCPACHNKKGKGKT